MQDFSSIYVVFVEEHSHEFVSGFGHLFVCLPEHDVDGVEGLLASTALNFGADTSPLGKGVWVGEYKLQACHELVRKNTFFDQRRLTVFKLGVPSSHLVPLKADLEERMSKEYPYDFLRHNCGHYIWDWLNGPEEDPTAILYLTPREALAKILAEYPPISIQKVLSNLEILEDRVSAFPGMDRAGLRGALADPMRLGSLDDLGTRLLAIKVAESSAGQEEYAYLQELRAATLAEAGGPEAARKNIARQMALSRRDNGPWPLEAEGPAVSVMATGDSDHESVGFRVTVEAGLRDPFTEPIPQHVLKDTRFLKASVEGIEESLQVEFLLISLSTLRDARSLIGGLSNGFVTGYTDLPNPLGTSGLFASTWGGLSIQTDAGWFGSRLSLTADELHDRASAQVTAGLTWDLILPEQAVHAELHLGGDGVGAGLRHDVLLSNSFTFRTEWTHSPDGHDVASAGLQIRF